MTSSYVATGQEVSPARPSRTARTRRYAMTPPTFFAVEYAINPWMDITTPVDVDVAQAQWKSL